MAFSQSLFLGIMGILFIIWFMLSFFVRRWWVLALGWSVLALAGVWYFGFFPWLSSFVVLVILLAALRSKNRLQFYEQIDAELLGLKEQQKNDKIEITREGIEKLPPLVRKWLEASGVVEGKYGPEVCIGQTGEMKTAEKGNWMPFKAKQNTFLHAPGFLWQVEVRFMKGMNLYGRDFYSQGKGSMLIRLGYLFRVVNSAGPKIDQGTLLRFLGEMVWYPQAALCAYVHWEDLSDNRIKAVMKYGKVEAEGIFHLNEKGEFRRFEAQRYMSNKLRPWIIEVEPEGFKHFGSLYCPARLQVSWLIDNTKWTWLKLEVNEVAPAR